MQDYIYQVQTDTSKPGSYTVVDGLYLIDESVSLIGPTENFQTLAGELIAQGKLEDGIAARYVWVRMNDNDECEIVEES